MTQPPDGPDRPVHDPAGQVPPPPPPPPPAYGAPAADATQQPAYGQPGYGQPAYGQPGYGEPARRGSNALAITALVLGVLGVVFFFFPPLGLILGIIAIVLGILGRRKASRGEAGQGGLALAGIIAGAIAVVIAVLLLVVLGSLLNKAQDCAQLPQDQQQTCIQNRVNS